MKKQIPVETGHRLKYRKNVYLCQKCKKGTVTVDRDAGVTPFMTRCRVDECDGNAQSVFYNCDQSLPPTHEWYRPDPLEIEMLEPGTRAHVERGGLLLREINWSYEVVAEVDPAWLEEEESE